MKLVKHDVVENYVSFNNHERIDIILQELSKTIMMFPTAILDILNVCNIKNDGTPDSITKSIEQNANDLKLLNKLVKVSLVANMELQDAKGQDLSKKHYRDIMVDKNEFFKKNNDIVQDAVLKLRDFLNSKNKENFAKEVNEYLNMDGENSTEKPFVSSIDKVKIDVKNLVIVAVVIAGIYYFVKNKT
jgi:hypothetical protein